LAPDFTLITLLSVSPQYRVLHSCVTFRFWPQISLSSPYCQSPHNIHFFTPLLPSPFGPRYHSHHPVISLPTIYSSSPLCYLPLLAPDITLIALLSVSPQCAGLLSCVTFSFWPQISLSAHYYQSPHNIQFFTPLLPSTFGPRYQSQHPIISLPTIYSSSPLSYLPHLAPNITLSTLLSVSPQYTVLHPYVTFHFWPQISLSAPYYQSPHNIQFFTPVLVTNFGPRFHSQHPIISLPTIYVSSPLCYLPILAPDITHSTLLSVSPQYTFLQPCVTIHFWPKVSLSAPYYQSNIIYSSSPLC